VRQKEADAAMGTPMSMSVKTSPAVYLLIFHPGQGAASRKEDFMSHSRRVRKPSRRYDVRPGGEGSASKERSQEHP
jgi:hypothetical protein